MVFLSLFLHAAGSGVMIMAVLGVGALLVHGADYVCRFVVRRDDAASAFIENWHLAILPGALVQIWYAALAAYLVGQESADASLWYLLALHGTAIVGQGLAAWIFVLVYVDLLSVESKDWHVYTVIGIAAVAHVLFFVCPAANEVLGVSWLRTMRVASLLFNN